MRGGARSGQYRRGPDRARRRRNGRCAGRGRGRGGVPGPRPRRFPRLAARRWCDLRRPDAGPARPAGGSPDRRRPPGRGVARAPPPPGRGRGRRRGAARRRARVHQHRDAHRPHPARPAGLGPGRARRPSGVLARRARLAVRAGRRGAPGRVGGRPSARRAGRPRLAGPAAGPRGGRAGHATAARAIADRAPVRSRGRGSRRHRSGDGRVVAPRLPASRSHDAVHGRRARRRGDRGGPGWRLHRAPAVDADPGRAVRGSGRGRGHVPRRRLRAPTSIRRCACPASGRMRTSWWAPLPPR